MTDFNDPDFIASVASDYLTNPTFRVKKKMARGGSYEFEGDTLTLTWEKVPGWRGNPFGVLRIVRQMSDSGWGDFVFGWLSRPDHNTGISLASFGEFDDGEEVGFYLLGTESNVRTDILRVVYEETERPPAPTPTSGAKQYVMAPILPLMNRKWINDHFDHLMFECGFHGFHVPLQGEIPDIDTPHGEAFFHLLDRCAAAGRLVWPWLAGDKQSDTVPDDLLGHTRSLLLELGSDPSIKRIGLGYDTFEWASRPEVQAWVDFANSMNPEIEFGARAGNGGDNNTPGTKLPGDFASYEWHMRPGAQGWRQQLEAAKADAGSLPCAWAERGRVRGLYDKDPKLEDVPRMIRDCMEVGVDGIWGIQDARGSISDYGSGRWPNAAAIKAAIGSSAGTNTTGESDVIKIRRQDMRSFLLRIGGARGEVIEPGNGVAPWPVEATTAEVELTTKNTKRLWIYATHGFIGKEAARVDEQTGTLYIVDDSLGEGHPEFRRPIPCMWVAEKDHPTSGFTASHPHLFPMVLIEIPKGGCRFVLAGRHGNTGTGGQNPDVSNYPHIEARIYAFVDWDS